MLWTLFFWFFVVDGPTQPLVFSFALDANASKTWVIQNDNVMGGVSEGSVQWQTNAMRWYGHTRLQNNGGFSSIRSPREEWDLSKFQHVHLRCKGTGGPFKLVLDTETAWYLPHAEADFEVEEGWTDIIIPLKDFIWKQTGRGILGDVQPKQELGQVLRLGLMKYDGTAQPFELIVSSMAFE